MTRLSAVLFAATLAITAAPALAQNGGHMMGDHNQGMMGNDHGQGTMGNDGHMMGDGNNTMGNGHNMSGHDGQ